MLTAGRTRTAAIFSHQIKSCSDAITGISNPPDPLQDLFCHFVQAGEKMKLNQIEGGMTDTSEIFVWAKLIQSKILSVTIGKIQETWNISYSPSLTCYTKCSTLFK